LDNRRRDGGTNSTLRIKEQGMHLTLNEHDDDDDDDEITISSVMSAFPFLSVRMFTINNSAPTKWIFV